MLLSVDLLGVILGINCLVFQKELINRGLPSDPTIYTTSLAFCGSFHLPHDLYHSTLLYSIHFSSPIAICLKNFVTLKWRTGFKNIVKKVFVS